MIMGQYLVSPSPHIHTTTSTRSIMRDVIISLSPAVIASIVVYGWTLLIFYAVSIFSCVLIEWAVTKFLLKKPSTIGDLSAVVTAILLAMNLPATTPLWIIFIGALVAIGVAKMSFGGLGQNVFNPAITARVFLFISFPKVMTDWNLPKGSFIPNLPELDAYSGSTPLTYIKEALSTGKPLSEILTMPMFHEIGGSIGELSSILLLIGAAYLVIRRVIKPWIPLSIIGTIAIFSGIFSTINPDLYTGPMLNIFTGGVILGACFMATDYVTSPMSNLGGIIYGIGIGLIVMLIRYFGAYPEGMSFAILIMNCVVPLLNKWFHNPKFGRS